MHAPTAFPTRGYLDKKSRHPQLLAAAVALHVALIGTILSYHPEVLVKGEDALILKKFPPVAPPPPVEPDARKRAPKTKADARPERPTPPLRSDPVIDRWPEVTGDPPADLGSGGGTIELEPPAKPVPPVFVSARGDPRFDRDRQPPYPPALERLEVEGSVTVRLQVGTDGRVLAVELVSADDPAFFTSTRDWAFKRWRFRPATRDGEAVVSWLTRTVHFRIVRDRNA